MADRFAEAVCNRQDRLWVIFFIASVFLFLSIAFLSVLGPDSPSYVISALNILTMSVFAGLSGLAIWLCR